MRRRLVPLLAAAATATAASLALAAPGDISLVSVASDGSQRPAPANASAVSAEGRFAAFSSPSNFTEVLGNGDDRLFVRDRASGTTVLASSSAAGAVANASVDTEDVGNVQFAISGNGRYVVFASNASNLAPPADTDTNKDVFRKDLQTGAVALVSVNSAGQKANAAIFGDPDVSYDGRRVSFGSGAATNLFPSDDNNASDVVVRDIDAGTTVLAAQSAAGLLANGTTERSAISADGRVVVFEAPAGTTNLLPNDSGAANDVIVRNLAAGTTSGASDPTKATGSGFPDISGDGRHIVFETGEKYAGPVIDVSAGNDVYGRDMTTGAIVLASARDGLDTGGGAGGARPAVSADGARVAFTSASTDLFGTDANAVTDVFVRDLSPRSTRRSSVQANGTTETSTASEKGAIAGNGGVVTFVNDDNGAVPELLVADANNQPDVLAKEFAPTDATPPAITLSATGGTATDPSGIGEVTVNGAPVAVGAGGTFPVPAGPGTKAVRAVDGAGNAATQTLTATPATTPRAVQTSPRIQRLRVGLKGRRLTVRFRLATNARVTVTLLRRTLRAKPRRTIVLRTAARPVARSLLAGQRTIVVTLKKRPAAGRYVVRVRARAGNRVTTKTTPLVVKPPKRR